MIVRFGFCLQNHALRAAFVEADRRHGKHVHNILMECREIGAADIPPLREVWTSVGAAILNESSLPFVGGN